MTTTKTTTKITAKREHGEHFINLPFAQVLCGKSTPINLKVTFDILTEQPLEVNILSITGETRTHRVPMDDLIKTHPHTLYNCVEANKEQFDNDEIWYSAISAYELHIADT